MLFFIVATLCLHSVASDRDLKDYDLPQFVALFRNILEYRPEDVRTTDVTFYLFTRNSSNVPISLSTRGIDTNKSTKIVIHGYLDNHNRSWYHRFTDEYLKNGDFNVIQVDWGRVALSSYPSTAQNTRIVGQIVAKFILNQDLHPKKVHIVGHSLGAHIAAFAAQIVKTKKENISRITALDPAGPGFRSEKKKNRLDAKDADVVDVVHTDGTLYGYYSPIGTFDIYINGGVGIQPDCTSVHVASIGEFFEDTYCSHTRSYVRFIEMINDVKYSCYKCESLVRYMMGLCGSNEVYVFGAEDINTKMRGVCFVDTNNKS